MTSSNRNAFGSQIHRSENAGFTTSPRRRRTGKKLFDCIEALEKRVLLSGLTGQYFSSGTGTELTGYLPSQSGGVTNINFSSGTFPPGLPGDFAARWEGYLDPSVTGTYSFYVDVDGISGGDGYNGGDRLSLAPVSLGSQASSQALITDWNSHSAEDNSTTSKVNLTAGTNYAIRMEYISYNGSGSASAILQWSANNSSGGIVVNKGVVPVANLKALNTSQSTYSATQADANVSSGSQISGAPTGWKSADIGPVNGVGSTNYAGGVFTVSGDGTLLQSGPSGIVNDAFQYAYQQVSGDFTITAEITSMTDPGVSTDGLMMRSALSASVPSMMMFSLSSGQPGDLRRWAAGADSEYQTANVNPESFPYWLEIVRYGNDVVTYFAPNSGGAPGAWVQVQGQDFTNLPASVYVGMAATSRSAGYSTANFSNVSITPLSRAYETSFIGNTAGGGQDHVMTNVLSAYVDPGTGQSFMVGTDEDDSLSIYNEDGSFVGFGNDSHYQGGIAVAEDSDFVYAGQTPGYTYDDYGVQTYDHYGIAVRSAIMGTDTVNGMAVIGHVLYVATDNMVYGYNTSNLAFNGTVFEVDNAGNMAVDSAGTGLWIIQTSNSSGSPDVVHYTISNGVANKDSDTISFSGLAQTVIPRGIAVSPVNGEVYVTDIGALQDIHVYNGSNAAYITDYGYQYGIYGTGGETEAGAAAPMKFIFPVGVGIDDSGNVYVFNSAPIAPAGTPYTSHAAGTIMQKYSPTGTLLWENDGLEYVDTADPDPASPTDLYSDFWHYQINYNDTTAGTETVLVGALVDPFATNVSGGATYQGYVGASDPRLIPPEDIAGNEAGESARAGAEVREFDSSKFLFDFDQHASAVNIYKFKSGTQFTIFCGELVRESDRGDKHGSDDAFYIWTDDSGQGVKLGGESFATGYEMSGASYESVSWYIDANGDIWIGGDNGTGSNEPGNVVREYIPKGFLNAAGAPIYTNYNGTSGMYNQVWNVSSFTGITELCRAVYDSTTGSMYLSGYGTGSYNRASGDTSGGTAGTVLYKFSNWNISGTADVAWGPVYLPYQVSGGDKVAGYSICSLEIAGGADGYLFASYGMNNALGVQVYNVSNGALVTNYGVPLTTTLESGPEIAGGSDNGPDFRNSLTVTQLSDGEYIIFNEEVEEAKITMFRWTPPEMPGLWGDLNIGTNASGTTLYTSAGSWSQSSLGGNLSDGTAPDVFNMASQPLTGDGQIETEVDSIANGGAGTSKGGIIFRDGVGAGAVYVALVVNSSAGYGLELQDRTTVNGNGARVYRVSGQSNDVAPLWLRLVRDGNIFTGYYSLGSATPTTWTSMGAGINVPMSATVDAGTAVGASSTTSTATANFSNVALAQGAQTSSGVSTEGLTDYDIGSPTPAGSSSFDSDSSTWVVSGGGGDIWGTSDSFHLTAETYVGDGSNGGSGSIVARVTYEDGTQPWAKAGVMFRNDATAGAANATVLVTPPSGSANTSEGVVFQYRNASGGVTSDIQIAGLSGPIWVALINDDNTFTGYYSLDGMNWNIVGSATFSMSSTPLVGLAVSSHGSGALNDAIFTNVAITTSNTIGAVQSQIERVQENKTSLTASNSQSSTPTAAPESLLASPDGSDLSDQDKKKAASLVDQVLG